MPDSWCLPYTPTLPDSILPIQLRSVRGLATIRKGFPEDVAQRDKRGQLDSTLHVLA